MLFDIKLKFDEKEEFRSVRINQRTKCGNTSNVNTNVVQVLIGF